MVFGVEKGCVFTKYWCFRELVKRYPSIFLITLSQTMNTNGLDFWGLVGFEMLVRWFVSFFIRGSIFFIHYMAHLVHIWGCNFCIGQMRYYIWITLSICFALLFSFGNFVNWWLSSDWMGFGYTMNNAIHNYRNVLHFVRNFVDFRTFTWTTSFASSVF